MPRRSTTEVGTESDVPGEASLTDDFINHLVPDDLDWQGVVLRYPKSSLAIAVVGGFLLGRARGREIVLALATLAADSVSDVANEFIGKEVL